MFVLKRETADNSRRVPETVCDLCAASAEKDDASLLLRILPPDHEREPQKMRSALVLPDGRALYGTSFVLCSRCAAEVHQQTACSACLPSAGWALRPLAEAMTDIDLRLVGAVLSSPSSRTEE